MDGLSENQLAEYKIRFENKGMEFNEDVLKMMYVFGSIVGLIFVGFFVFLAVQLWRGKNWARITVIVFSFISAFFSFISLLSGNLFSTIDFIISLIIALYLMLDKKVYHAFNVKEKEVKVKRKKK